MKSPWSGKLDFHAPIGELVSICVIYFKEGNLLSEQLGKDAVSRVHRLELENKHLKQVGSNRFEGCQNLRDLL